MKILALIGQLLFIMMHILVFFLNILQPKWYWENFIPKLHEKEDRHPVITCIILMLLVTIIMIGLMSAIQ